MAMEINLKKIRMRIGRIFIRRASSIKHILNNRNDGTEEDFVRMIQVYSCRFCGICIYRDEKTFMEERKMFYKDHFKDNFKNK